MSEEQILSVIRRVLDGDANAFEAIVREYERNVYNIALRMSGEREDALDISQEAFLKAYHSLHSFRGESKFSVWLYRIVSNTCLDFLRERKIQGSSMGSNHFRVDMPRLVDFYLRGRLHLEDWISAKLKLSEINEGFANMKAGKTLRSVIVFDS